MNRYLLKVNGEKHCPGGISRPKSTQDWDGGRIKLPITGPVLAGKGKRPQGEPIQPGDALWIWVHEHELNGQGLGMTATAVAGEIGSDDDFLLVSLREIDLLDRPFGFRDLGSGNTGSRLLDEVQSYRHFRAYQIEDTDYAEFLEVVNRRSNDLPDEVRQSYAEGWEREVLNHKDDLLAGLNDRKASTQKARPGQATFRDALMNRYRGRCVISKCAIPEALEAAHVMPHTGDPKWDHPDNGMLLRRDLHSLFDAMLWSIDQKNNRMCVAERLKTTMYGKLDGREIDHQVAPALLEVHFRQFKKGG